MKVGAEQVDQIGILKEVRDETVQRRNAAIEEQQAAEIALNNLRVNLKIVERQAQEAVSRDEAVSQKMTQVRDLYNGSLVKPQALLTKLDALTTEQVETARARKQAREIVATFTSAVAQAETKLAVARANFEMVSNEITQLDAEMQRVRVALN
jgi:hypothetical protein